MLGVYKKKTQFYLRYNWPTAILKTALVIDILHMKEDEFVLFITPANAPLRVYSYRMEAC